jgi:phosphoglycerate dehydrogenase-like enzyme
MPTTAASLPRVAVLDDYQHVARTVADWSALDGRAEITIFHDHLTDLDELVTRLTPFEAICIMRERTPLKRPLLERLPNLELIASTGPRNAAIDLAAAKDRGVEVKHTGYGSASTIEHTWALLLASARHLVAESNDVRAGGWQLTLGANFHGKTLGLLGLGNIGSEVAKIGRAFGMKVIAWSQNLTAEKASEHGAELVTKEELFRQADYLSVHLVLSDRSRGLVGAPEIALMKPSARLVNTSRGPIVDEAALVSALREGRIAGAALDTFDVEPLPADHPFRTLPRVLTTPHIGYVTEDLYRTFYGDTVTNLVRWLDERTKS